MNIGKTLIFSPPPTPNGDLHLGHLSGPYLRADIYRRYQALRGRRTWLLCGADEHQSYVARKAEQIGLTPDMTSDRYSSEIEATLEAAAIGVDLFSRPRHSKLHKPFVREFFLRLFTSGKLVAKQTACLYCDHCDRFLHEAYVYGGCPHCGEIAGGNSCECCGKPNDCSDLIDPACSRCRSTPSIRLQTRLHFPLQPYADQLLVYYRTAALPPRVRALCEDLIASGLPEIAVTHASEWGLPLPLDQFGDQRLYVWFEMSAGLLAAAEELTPAAGLNGGWRDLLSAHDSQMVTFCGYDNCFFYALLFPALFLAFDPDIRLSSAFVVNEFYSLDGSKFSTSRNHAIWARELLATEPRDSLRAYLAFSGPETAQTNFTRERYAAFVQEELEGVWNAGFRDLYARSARYSGGRAPAPAQWTPQHHRFSELALKARDEIALAYEPEAFSPARAIRLCCELVRVTRQFAQSEAHWTQAASGLRYWPTALALEVAAWNLVSICASPVMPDFAAQVCAAFARGDSLAWPEDGLPWVQPNTPIPDISTELFHHEYNQLLSQRIHTCA